MSSCYFGYFSNCLNIQEVNRKMIMKQTFHILGDVNQRKLAPQSSYWLVG